MRNNIIIISLLLFLLWSGFKGLSLLGSYANSAANSEVSVTEVKKGSKKSNTQTIKRAKTKKENLTSTAEKQKVQNAPVKKQGELALNEIRGQRMSQNGKMLSNKEFYSESTQQETKPYIRKENTGSSQLEQKDNQFKISQIPSKNTVSNLDKSATDEMRAKGAAAIKQEKTSSFNIEKGTDTPKNYNTVAKERISTKTSTLGNYLVVAGSFSSKSNAENELKRFKRKGYSYASIVSTPRLHLIALNRYHSPAPARKRVAVIKKQGIDVFMKKIK